MLINILKPEQFCLAIISYVRITLGNRFTDAGGNNSLADLYVL